MNQDGHAPALDATLAELNGRRGTVVAELLELRHEHVQAIYAIDKAISNLTAGRAAPGTGTFPMLDRYIAEGWDGEDDITPGPAAEWMLAHGWVTGAVNKRRAASQAMAHFARPPAGQAPRLIHVPGKQGAYRPIRRRG